MGFFILCLIVSVIILFIKLSRQSEKFNLLETNVNLLREELKKLIHRVQELQGSPNLHKTAEPQHTPPSQPAEKEKIIPVPASSIVRPKPETVPFSQPPKPPQPISPTPPPQPPKPSMPPPQPSTPMPVWTPPTTPKKPTEFDWENLVGVKLFSGIAGVALLLAAVFFFRYSINQGWLMPPVRMAIGIIVGIGLLILCELKAARKYPATANAMDASAIAILFATFFAARALWGLIGATPAFLLMALVTAVAVLLSIRRDSVFIALLGLVGGFATPALLSSGENRPIALFSYLILLNAGLAWIAIKKNWPALKTLCMIFTVIYQWGWVVKFLTVDQLPLAMGIFLVFPLLAFVMTSFLKRDKTEKEGTSQYGQWSGITRLLPLLFVLYTAAVPGYGSRYMLLFSFLFLLDAGFFAIAAARGSEILHVAGGISTVMIFGIWFSCSYDSSAYPGVLLFICLFVLFYLSTPFIARRFNRDFTGPAAITVYTAPVLLFTFPVLTAIEPACAQSGWLFHPLFLLMLATSLTAIFAEEGFLYFIAAFFTLLTETIWAAKYLTPDNLYAGLATFAIFGLLYIFVPVLARRWEKALKPEWAGGWLILISMGLLLFLVSGPMASAAIWGFALLLLFFNAGLHSEGSAIKNPMLSITGILLSWLILWILWLNLPLTVMLIPALIITAGFAIMTLVGNLWMYQRLQGREASISANGTLLGLVGHLFLMAVAAQSNLSIPPWPLLGILLLLNLAIGLSSLYLRRIDLHFGAMACSAIILLIWTIASGVAPWPNIAILAAGALSLFSIVWIVLAGKRGIFLPPFYNTAAITIILSQIVTIVAALQAGAPGFGFLVVTHLILLITLLILAGIHGNHSYAIAAVFTTAVAVTTWFVQHSEQGYWQQQFLFAIPVYLIFIAYPLILGRRSGRQIMPYLAAVMANVPFFFQARLATLQAGWENYIGILPVVQALLMALLLIRLLKIERKESQHLGRLALVAGTVLAFITVAIPLQLEKEWITIGWALEGAALAWLFGRIPHKGLLYSSYGLFSAVFIRLAMNPYVLDYRLRGETRIFNWYLYTYLISAAAMLLGGWLLSKKKIDASVSPIWWFTRLLPAGGVVLLFLLLNIEIADYYSIGTAITFKFSATLAQDLTYTLAWALFAIILLTVGIMIKNQPARIASLALLVLTILKCFLHDLSRLGELYRVASFVGLAISLALVALALQKFVLSARKEGK
jgi:uncharacterized membrane protein